MAKTDSLHDKDIREPLFEYLEETYKKCRIFEEKRMGNSRADIVMVLPDTIVGMEIKSDVDSYARLESQTADYDLYYDLNYVVVGTSHAMHIEEHVPAHWGIITVELVQSVENGENGQPVFAGAAPDFYVLRKAKPNPNLDWRHKLSILWRPELAHIQELNDMPKYKSMSKANLIDKMLEKIPRETLQVQICEALFERDYETIAETINAFRVENGKKKRNRSKKKKRRYRALF